MGTRRPGWDLQWKLREGRGGPRLFGEAEVLIAEALSYPTQPCAFLPNPSIFPCHCSQLLALGRQHREDTSSLNLVSVGDKGLPG